MTESRRAAKNLWLFAAISVLVWNVLWLTACGLVFIRVTPSIENQSIRPVAQSLVDTLRLGAPPFHDSFHSYITWARQRRNVIKGYWNLDPYIRYVTLWSNGGTVALLVAEKHSRPHLITGFIDHALPPQVWPSHPGEKIRIIHAVPWDHRPRPMGDLSLPISWPGGFSGHLSVGVSMRALDNRDWSELFRQRWLIGGLDLAGMLVILGLVILVGLRLHESQQRQIQAMRARTSLLSERGMLASILAHEVRSPLTALRFNLHFLRTIIESPPSDQSRMLDIISTCQREMRRLDAMLDDFLVRTQVVSPPEETPINAVVAQAMDFLMPSMQAHGIRVVKHLDPGNPTVVVSADELRQVLLNLCTNAQEAMTSGGTLAISTVGEAESVVLFVRDSGKGVPADLHERLFEPFFSTKPNGSGLGLALVRRVVSGAGGSIYFESTPGTGTTFRVVLPRPKASGGDAAKVNPSA
jgi:signal transduction histidine kinase